MRITGIGSRRAVRMLAPAVECLGDLRKAGPGGEQPHPEIEILGPAPLVPAARVLEDVTANEPRSMREGAVDEELGPDLLVLEKCVVPRGPAAHSGSRLRVREQAYPRAHHVEFGTCGKERELAFEPAAMRQVVGVVPRHPGGAREAEGRIQGGREPARGRVLHDDSPIPAGGRVEGLAGAVRRSVVDRDHLELGLGLPHQRQKGRGEPGPGVADGKQNGKARGRSGHADTVAGRFDAMAGHRLLILGGGFGGLDVARAVGGSRAARDYWDTVLVDKENFFQFNPLLPAVAVGAVETRHIVYPLRDMARRRHLRFQKNKVMRIALARRVVELHNGLTEAWDTLVIALGSVTNWYDVPGAEANARPFKTIVDAMTLRARVVEQLDRKSTRLN